jgi:NAD(P)-dependent dehydrogenase (short-subunit alcohol dehydrogenase family)
MSRIADLESRAVLITGASQGIGAELARAFAVQGGLGERCPITDVETTSCM